MKVVGFAKKRLTRVLILIVFVFVFVVSGMSMSFGMQHYYKVDFSTAIVTASTLNVRAGPGTQYKVVATVKKNEYIRVFAGVGNWYIVQVEGDYVGAVSKQYVKPIYPGINTGSASQSTGNSGGSKAITSDMNVDEQEVFDLINRHRTDSGLAALKSDPEVQRIARIKAKEMVDSNYFSHTSPTYGSPFDMLKKFGVPYKSAGENIAGNSSNSEAVIAWMNSSGHRANILNSSYNYTGIGVVTGSKYGKIYVQMFVGR